MQAQIVPISTMENQLTQAGQDTVTTAKELQITDGAGWEGAAEFLRDVKRRMKQVTDYWSQPKAKAKAAHQEIVDKEKAMLAPLTEAERIVKGSMSDYQRQIEGERRRAQQQAEAIRQQEAARLLGDAIRAETSGDGASAEMNLAMAQMVEDMPSAPLMASAPTATGTSVRKAWKARVTDPSLVPIGHAGTVIRPIDQSALNNIARMTKGSIQIPGVEFYEDQTISVRA